MIYFVQQKRTSEFYRESERRTAPPPTSLHAIALLFNPVVLVPRSAGGGSTPSSCILPDFCRQYINIFHFFNYNCVQANTFPNFISLPAQVSRIQVFRLRGFFKMNANFLFQIAIIFRFGTEVISGFHLLAYHDIVSENIISALGNGVEKK